MLWLFLYLSMLLTWILFINLKTGFVFLLAMFSKSRLIVFISLMFSLVGFVSMGKRFLEKKGSIDLICQEGISRTSQNKLDGFRLLVSGNETPFELFLRKALASKLRSLQLFQLRNVCQTTCCLEVGCEPAHHTACIKSLMKSDNPDNVIYQIIVLVVRA